MATLRAAAPLALLWFVLTGGSVSSWIVGVPTIAVALAFARPLDRLAPPLRLDPSGVLRFVTYFVRESLRGGIDVGRRVCARQPRVAPGLVRYRWRLPAGSPRALFVVCVSLLPGTLITALGETEVMVHALDTGTPVADELADLEQCVAGLFALSLPAAGATDA